MAGDYIVRILFRKFQRLISAYSILRPRFVRILFRKFQSGYTLMGVVVFFLLESYLESFKDRTGSGFHAFNNMLESYLESFKAVNVAVGGFGERELESYLESFKGCECRIASS